MFSKILTDSDSLLGQRLTAADQYNRGLEKSIGQFDVTHNFKFGCRLRPAVRQRQTVPDLTAPALGCWATGA